MASVQVIEINGVRFVNMPELLQMVAMIRERSTTRKEALKYIVQNLKEFEVTELRDELRVHSSARR